MTTKKPDGGPAFPDPGRAQSGKTREKLTHTGISMRDWFATYAPGMPASFERFAGESDIALMARWRWLWADAMLAAREA